MTDTPQKKLSQCGSTAPAHVIVRHFTAQELFLQLKLRKYLGLNLGPLFKKVSLRSPPRTTPPKEKWRKDSPCSSHVHFCAKACWVRVALCKVILCSCSLSFFAKYNWSHVYTSQTHHADWGSHSAFSPLFKRQMQWLQGHGKNTRGQMHVLFLYIKHVVLCMRMMFMGGVHATWWSEDNLWVSFLLLPLSVVRIKLKLPGLGGKCLYLLCRLASPKCGY